MGATYSRLELATGDFVWLVLIEFASREFLFSSSFVDPSDFPADRSLSGVLGGDLDISDESDILSPTSSGRSVSFPDMVFPVDISALIEAGHPFSSATGELSLWKVGDSFDNRQVIISGPVDSPWYGEEGEPIALSIEESPFDDSELFPSTLQVISTETVIAEATEGDVGVPYPMIFGNPGVFVSELGAVKEVAGSPAPIRAWQLDNTSNVLVAGHAIEFPATLLVIDTDGATETFSSAAGTVDIEDDLLGNTITTIDISSASTIDKTSDSFFIGWNRAGAGGISNGISGAGDVLEDLLGRSSLRIAAGKMSRALGALNQYQLDFVIDESNSPWNFINDNLVPILPISFLSSSEGIYPVVWKLDATTKDAIVHILAGVGGASRESAVRYERSVVDVRNDLRLNFALNYKSDEYKRFRTLRPEIESSVAGSYIESSSFLARKSADLYGRRSESIDSSVIYDDATAALVLDWKLRAIGFLHRSVEYRVDREFGWLSPGDVATLTDDALSISNRVCLVRSVKWESEREVLLELLILDYGD